MVGSTNEGIATAPTSPLLEWLRREHHDRRNAAGRSVLGTSYDFYYDLVVRHIGAEKPALRWLDTTEQWRELSFADLHQHSARLAGEWLGAGVQPGDTVALVLPMGPAFAVAALTATRLGLCFSFVPPTGRLAVRNRLAALGECHVVAAANIERWLGDHAARVLRPTSKTTTAPERSVSYASADPVCKLFSPLRASSSEPATLRAEDAFLCALRDGAAVFGLQRGTGFAAPGFDALQHQPSLLWASLLAGATYVHLTAEQVAKAPSRLWERAIEVIGVTLEIRDVLRQHGKRGSWRLWFKNPEEPFDGLPWCSFVSECAPDSEMRNVLVEAAGGGVLLAGKGRRGDDSLPVMQNVAAAPGTPHALLDIGNPERPALDEVGFLAVGTADTFAGSKHVIVCPSGDGEYLYAGNADARRVGRVYPFTEVCEVVNGMPGVEASCVASIPSARAAFLHRFVLVVFGTDLPAHATFKEQIALELGRDAVPDDVETSHLTARRDEEGEVDVEWCRNQCLTGSLHRKGEIAVFQQVADLRRRLATSAG